jgi:hypothetical protein
MSPAQDAPPPAASPADELAAAQAALETAIQAVIRALTFRVPPDFGRRFRVYAAERRMRLSDVLIRARWRGRPREPLANREGQGDERRPNRDRPDRGHRHRHQC